MLSDGTLIADPLSKKKLTPSCCIVHARRCLVHSRKQVYRGKARNDRDGHEEEHRVLDQNAVTDRDPLSVG